MSFSLRKVQNGEQKIFSNKLILEMLGDTINDEIKIDGEVYRISSFFSLSGEGSGTLAYIWEIIDLPIIQNNEQEFSLNQDIEDLSSVMLVINHVIYRHQLSFHISNQLLYWHGEFDLETSDQMYLRFMKSIQ